MRDLLTNQTRLSPFSLTEINVMQADDVYPKVHPRQHLDGHSKTVQRCAHHVTVTVNLNLQVV